MQYIACAQRHTTANTHARARASRHFMNLLCRGTPQRWWGGAGGRRREQQGIELDLVLSAKVRDAKVHGPPLLLRRLRRV